jgi:hypothetical protein
MIKKGFIGAIGDDLPSLIPIFLGLMIFFSVFLNTYNVYKDNTDLYSLKSEAISVSAIMKEEPVILNLDTFKKTCSKVNTKFKWNAFLVDFDLNSDNYVSLTKENLEGNILKEGEGEDEQLYVCDSSDVTSFLSNTSSEVIIYQYPTTTQKDLYIKPARLYVVVWR